LREFFQIEKNKYRKASDLLKRTIRPALKELNESDFAAIWDVKTLYAPGKGKPVGGITFKAMIFDNRDEKDKYLAYIKTVEGFEKGLQFEAD